MLPLGGGRTEPGPQRSMAKHQGRRSHHRCDPRSRHHSLIGPRHAWQALKVDSETHRVGAGPPPSLPQQLPCSSRGPSTIGESTPSGEHEGGGQGKPDKQCSTTQQPITLVCASPRPPAQPRGPPLPSGVRHRGDQGKRGTGLPQRRRAGARRRRRQWLWVSCPHALPPIALPTPSAAAAWVHGHRGADG